MEEIKEILLKSLKGDLSEASFEVLAGMDAEQLMLTAAVLRELLPLVDPEKLKELVRSRSRKELVRKVVKLRTEAVPSEGILKTERRLILAAVTRYFAGLERELSRRGDVSLRLTRDFFETLRKSVEQTLDRLQKQTVSEQGKKSGESS